MKKLFLIVALAWFAAIAGRAADTVELLPGKITGSVGLSSETVQSGSISVYATDNSGASASSSFNGSTYTLTVPAGKTWRVSFNLTLASPSGSYSSFYHAPSDQIAVAAGETVSRNFTFATTRVTATIQVSNGTLASIPSLQANASDSTRSFSSSAQNLSYVPVLPMNNTNVSGTARVTSNATPPQSSTQTLGNKVVNVSAAGASVSWAVDAAFAAGSISGNINLQGVLTPTNSNVYAYNAAPTGWTYLGGFNYTGNSAFQFDNLMAGRHYVAGSASFKTPGMTYNNASLNFSRYTDVTAGNVSTVDFAGTVALAQTSLQLTGFLTLAKISGANLYGNWTPPATNPDQISFSASSQLNSSGGFTTVVVPGEWRFSQASFSGQDTSVSGNYFYYSISIYDYLAQTTGGITFAAGDNKTTPGLSLNTTQTELTFDVIEPAGATVETKIQTPSINGYSQIYSPSGAYLGQRSFNAANYGTAQAKPRVRIIGVPGTYTVSASGNVDGSQVSFGNFTLELTAPLLTQVGTNVIVSPGAGVSLDFDQVTSAGVSTASQLPVGPALPGGYTGLTSSGQKVYYSVSTSATFSNYVDVTVTFDPAGVPAAQESRLKLFYYDTAASKWIDVTIGIDQVNNKVTGTSAALGTFALGLPHDPVLGTVTVPTAGLKGTSLAFSATFTDSDPGEAHKATWSWGDGSPTTTGTVNQSAGTIAGAHTYAAAGTYTGSVTLTDITGNTVTKTFTVTVGGGDTTAPVITVNANITAEATSATGALVTLNATANDDTDGAVTVTTDPASGSLFPLGTTTVTATAKDAAGNTATKTFTVTVVDTTAPVIAPFADLNIEAASPSGAVVTFTPTATDNTGSPVVTTSHLSGSTFPVGTTVVTITAKDSTGNTSTRTFNVTVADTTKPVISIPAATTLEATSAAGATFTLAATASDAGSSAVTITSTPASGSTLPIGATTVKVTATDAAGNVATDSYVVTVVDTTAPVIAPQVNLSTEATGPAGAVVSFAPSATDLTGNPTVTTNVASGSTFPIGSTTVTITAKDAYNNISTKTFNVVVLDTTAPVLAPLANLTVEATGGTGAAVSFAPTATDLAGAPTISTSVASGSVFPIGTTSVDVTAKDASGNSTKGTFTVTVRDSTAPVITVPANLTVEATSANGAVATFAATAADAVGATLTYSKAPGTVFPIGTTTVTVNAVDGAGNAAVAKTFTVTVRDTSGPVLTLPANLVVEATDEDGAKATFTVTANDLVSGLRTVTLSRTSGSKFPLGVTTVTATSKDALGNVSTGSFTVTVRDTTAPKLQLPRNLTVSATSAAGATVRYQVEAEDIVSEDKAIKYTYSKASGSVFPLGVTVVTVTATDAAGNKATGTFTVTVADTTRPVFTKLSLTPSRILANDRSFVNVTVTALATDRIDPTLNVRIVSVKSDDPVTGTAPGDVGPDWEITGPLTLKVRAERDVKKSGRIYTVAVAATDDAGNTVTRNLYVLVAKSGSTKFEDCDPEHRSEEKRLEDDDRENDSRDQGDRDDDDNDDNEKRARGK